VSISSTGPRDKRWGRLPDAQEESGLSRSSIYKLAAKHRGLFRKHGRSTIVDLTMLHAIIENAPVAEISVT
jgi:hypothetical protein